jgi:trans-aconitate 2-methyltransferase
MTDWQPSQYLAFADERTRPARDLLARIPLDRPGRVYDLGCGPGNSTELLVEAFPGAEITGIDNSPAMLQAARRALPGIAFKAGDLASWMPPQPADLLFSNAALQWVPDHLAVLLRLLGGLAPRGVLAVQMPDNLGEPSHRLMAETAGAGPWSERLAGAAAARDALPDFETCYSALKPHCAMLDIWQTAYCHPLRGAGGIVSWLKTTGLRPYLAPLDEVEQADFLSRYESRLAEAYPAMPDGTVLLRFPRRFIVAQV